MGSYNCSVQPLTFLWLYSTLQHLPSGPAHPHLSLLLLQPQVILDNQLHTGLGAEHLSQILL